MLKIIKNKTILNNSFIFLIPLVCFFFTISYSNEQNAIDAALIYGGFIDLPEGNSYNTVFNNSFSLIILITVLFLKYGFKILLISQIILFFSILMNFLGIYLIIKSIIKKFIDHLNSKLISFIFTYIALFILGLNLGMGDYPVVIFSEHTFGMYSASLPTLTVGLLANGNIMFAFFSAFILLAVHGVMGAWLIGVLFTAIVTYRIYYKELYKIKYVIIGSISGLILFILIFSVHYYLKGEMHLISNTEYDLAFLKNWDLYWETHRTNNIINYNYLSKSIFLATLIFVYINFQKKYLTKDISFALLTVALSIILGSIVYILYKVFLEFLPPFIKAPMPSRVLNMHSLIGWPIIFSITLIFIKELSHKTKIEFNKIFITCCAILFITTMAFKGKNIFNYIFAHYDKTIGINSVLKNNPLRTRITEFYRKTFYSEEKRVRNYDFWKKIKTYDGDSYSLVTAAHYKGLVRYGLKPLLIQPDAFDSVYYYFPFGLFIKDIIENVYNVPFDKPPPLPLKTYHGRVPTFLMKIEFEKKSYDNWLNISKKYNVKYLVLPKEWRINLPVEFSNEELSFYIIQ